MLRQVDITNLKAKSLFGSIAVFGLMQLYGVYTYQAFNFYLKIHWLMVLWGMFFLIVFIDIQGNFLKLIKQQWLKKKRINWKITNLKEWLKLILAFSLMWFWKWWQIDYYGSLKLGSNLGYWSYQILLWLTAYISAGKIKGLKMQRYRVMTGVEFWLLFFVAALFIVTGLSFGLFGFYTISMVGISLIIIWGSLGLLV